LPALISFRSVGHTYRSWRRSVRAVDDFTLDIAAGEVFGLAGPNGAGKSTLISLLLGFLPPTDGTVRIDELPPRAYVERSGIGYVSELMNVPPRWELRETLVRYALLAGIDDAELDARVDGAIARLGIEEHVGKRVKQLSKGNLQRLGIAQALLREERVLILDEPTHGLDPVWTQRFRAIVDELRASDRVIFIASHNLDELQRLADRVAIIDHGRLQRVVDTRGKRGEGSIAVAYRIALHSGDAVLRALAPEAVEVAEGEFELPPMDAATLNRHVATLLARGALLRALTPVHSSLEQAFREAVGDGTEEAQ
jgi:ABC-type multidrug transport system ATPase subunit